jgi:hypothetical protein
VPGQEPPQPTSPLSQGVHSPRANASTAFASEIEDDAHPAPRANVGALTAAAAVMVAFVVLMFAYPVAAIAHHDGAASGSCMHNVTLLVANMVLALCGALAMAVVLSGPPTAPRRLVLAILACVTAVALAAEVLVTVQHGAHEHGWRAVFLGLGAVGLVLELVYVCVAAQPRTSAARCLLPYA